MSNDNDPEELSQQTRVRELLERRKNVIDARDAAHEAMTFGEIDRRDALLYYRGKIESLIIDLWTKFKVDEDDIDASEYLAEKKIDTLTVPVPEELTKDLAPGAEPPEPQTETIHGLQWFLENDHVIETEYRVRTMSGGPGWETLVGRVMVPQRTLDKALLLCTEFMDQLGIDVELSVDPYMGGEEPGL